ncbi:putative membrane protein [Rickettsia felis str. Pedreira]|uniref:Putative membrane protein n=1 Tax=Rickettsia felis str. Pedreira TaxID=1359196 RepID=A0A0F3MTA3_RICFI|nr:putative membrane protein [Rickettsia felis str. Pedreira]
MKFKIDFGVATLLAMTSINIFWIPAFAGMTSKILYYFP